MERPILFSGEMVRAILAGRKTQTRRVARRLGVYTEAGRVVDLVPLDPDGDPIDRPVHCPYGAPGDRLWVRETWAAIDERGEAISRRTRHVDQNCGDRLVYRADDRVLTEQWRPSIFMPRWASRITLEVTAVRVERLQDITEEDACAEGVEASATTWVRHEPNGDWELSAEPFDGATPERATARDVYERLWHAINGKRAPWSSNPWVWVVSFRKAVA